MVLEPSCASVFRDELPNLFPNDPLAAKLKDQTLLLSEFLEQKAGNRHLPQLKRKALVQGHCHHKSVLKFDAEHSVLKKLGLDAQVLNSGCCGMAGSFGFESDKYDVSVAIGERRLLPVCVEPRTRPSSSRMALAVASRSANRLTAKRCILLRSSSSQKNRTTSTENVLKPSLPPAEKPRGVMLGSAPRPRWP